MTELPIDPAPDIPPAPELQPGPAPQRGTRRGPRSASTREPAREASRDGVFYGRDGEILTRKRTSAGDIFAIPQELMDPDWEYQWNAVTVNGNAEVLLDQNLMMAENGWRPVPADRPGFAGRFTPVGAKGSIIRGGQRLEERPKAMCDAARREEYQKAAGQMRDQNEALTGHKANLRSAIKDGLSMDRKYRGAGGDVRISIDRAADVPRPQYQYDTGE